MSNGKHDKIRISPKHGVNPSLAICFYCGKETGEILLMGKINKQDSEAPKHVCIDYTPCKNCQAKMAQGITIIGVIHEQPEDERPPINKDMYPTESWVTVSENFVKDHFNPDEVNGIIQAKTILMDDNVVQEIISHANPSTIIQ